MELPKDVAVWFEIPVLNFSRAKEFYSKIYDFEMPEEQMGPNLMGFFLMDQEKQGVGGAIVQGQGYVPSSLGSKVYLQGGEDLSVVLNKVEPSGGKVVLSKTLITEEIGYYAVFEDTEGNHICLHSKG